jgi:hypothetical protein
MTLKEKFKERLYNQSHDDSECLRIKFENIDKVIDSQEKIADDYVIEFTEWMNKTENRLGYHEAKNEWYHFDSGKWITTKELLEIYKKEKGL